MFQGVGEKQMNIEEARQLVAERMDAISTQRPIGSSPADLILARAVELYEGRSLRSRDLVAAAKRLASNLLGDIPDAVIELSPRSVSPAPRQVVVNVFEPRVVVGEGLVQIAAENNAVALTASGIHSTRGILPGRTGAHLFERIAERGGSVTSFAQIMLRLSRLWPTLLLMRARQRQAGRGVPPSAIVTPFDDGLLFGAVEKVVGMPPMGMTAAVVDRMGTRNRILRDWYAEGGEKVWVDTKTFVGASQLSSSQVELRNRLEDFCKAYPDVIADCDWKWRVGLGQADEAVEMIARAFRLKPVPDARREEAYDALEAIAVGDLWLAEVERNLANQRRKRKSGK